MAESAAAGEGPGGVAARLTKPDAGVVLEGFDGSTPLGFLAGVGVQRVFADRASASEGDAPLLSWRFLDTWRPVLQGPPSFDAVVDAVHEDAHAWESAPILSFRYLKVEKSGPKLFAGLRAPIAVLRRWLSGRREAGDDVSLAYACALMCETASESVEEAAGLEQLREHRIEADTDAPLDRASLRTFFDFTARNAQFLDQVAAIRGYLDRDVIEEGLRSGRVDGGAPRSMDWDPAADTPGAIYTGYTRGFLPVAEWLAFRGLVCFPVASEGAVIRTTACSGRRLAGEFVWPLWEVPVGPECVRSLVAYPGLQRLESEARQALGISAVLRAELTKKADGYSGMFSPCRPG
jgi:hypothetical protein